MSQPNPSAELEELITKTRAQAIRETAQRCVEICRREGLFAGDAIATEFLSKEDGT